MCELIHTQKELQGIKVSVCEGYLVLDVLWDFSPEHKMKRIHVLQLSHYELHL